MSNLPENPLNLFYEPEIKPKKRFDIVKTFEVFNKENIGILKDRIIKIILIEADNIFSKNDKLFNIDFIKQRSVQISVFNDKRTFSLLSSVWKRHQLKQGQQNDKNNKSGVFNELSQS